MTALKDFHPNDKYNIMEEAKDIIRQYSGAGIKTMKEAVEEAIEILRQEGEI